MAGSWLAGSGSGRYAWIWYRLRWPSFLRDRVVGCGQVGDDAVGAAFGMPRLTATSRNRAPGSRAMHGSARAGLVRKLQFATLRHYQKF